MGLVYHKKRLASATPIQKLNSVFGLTSYTGDHKGSSLQYSIDFLFVWETLVVSRIKIARRCNRLMDIGCLDLPLQTP
jgi:hypothetical protein